MKKLLFFTFVIVVAMGAGKSFAYTVPENDSNVEFFYVCGPKGDPLTGAEDHKQVLHIDIPEDEEGSIKISVFDPDTGGDLYDHENPEKGGDLDGRVNGQNPWDTETEITLTGKKGVKYSKRFGEGEYNRKFYNFKTLSKTDGVKTGSYYRFTLNITAVTGDDANLFKIKVSPEGARVSSPNITFRLLADEGAKMYFYPLLPEGTAEILVENYDLDQDGGTIVLHDPKDNKDYVINDSASGEWHQTDIVLSSSKERFLDVIITKGAQIEAQAGLRVSDMNGNPIPIHFRKKARPVLLGTCNEFTFDATSSFDPDNQALTYHWDFGDGTVSDEAVVTHRFEQGGDFNVILSVQDNSGLECDTAVTSQVVSVNTPPVASLTGPGKACTSQVVTFDASGTVDNTPDQITYNWDFGDGTSAEGAQVTKSFDKGGTYNIQLVVDDNAGTTCSTDSAGKLITINTNPVANAGKDIDFCLQHNRDYRVSFDGSGSTDIDGDSLTYNWDFGDGTGDSGVNVTHVYPRGGEYVATLSIDDGFGSVCSSHTDTVKVTLNKAPVAVAGDNITVCQGNEALFDGSGSIGEEGENLTYTWDFGDGTTEVGAKLAHIYQTGGIYKAVLTVNDLANTKCSTSSDSIVVTVNSKPSAIFSGVNSACTGEDVSFDASGTTDPDGDNLTYSWDFGDGTDAHGGTNVTHTYNAGGVYSVRLTVDDNKGTACSKDLAAMNVSINTPPVADAGPNHVCCLDAVSDFDGSGSSDADGDNLTYSWNFGDGNTGEGAKVTHVYSKSGTYIVTLTVNDNSGTKCDRSTDSFTATVNAKPTSIIQVR